MGKNDDWRRQWRDLWKELTKLQKSAARMSWVLQEQIEVLIERLKRIEGGDAPTEDEEPLALSRRANPRRGATTVKIVYVAERGYIVHLDEDDIEIELGHHRALADVLAVLCADAAPGEPIDPEGLLPARSIETIRDGCRSLTGRDLTPGAIRLYVHRIRDCFMACLHRAAFIETCKDGYRFRRRRSGHLDDDRRRIDPAA